MEHAHYLSKLGVETTDEDLKALITVIQLALFSKDSSQPEWGLIGVYQQAWETIVLGAESGGVNHVCLMLLSAIPLQCLAPPLINEASGDVSSSSSVTS